MSERPINKAVGRRGLRILTLIPEVRVPF